MFIKIYLQISANDAISTNISLLEMGMMDFSDIENPVGQLKDYYTSQMWGFNYTDTIGSECQRFDIMGIGESLLRNLKNNLTEAMELYSLLKRQSIYLSKLNIAKNDLPDILQTYYN